jgi:hypothetical protein
VDLALELEQDRSFETMIAPLWSLRRLYAVDDGQIDGLAAC